MTELITIVVIAIGLAMDAFAVSIVSGAAYRQLQIKHTRSKTSGSVIARTQSH